MKQCVFQEENEKNHDDNLYEHHLQLADILHIQPLKL